MLLRRPKLLSEGWRVHWIDSKGNNRISEEFLTREGALEYAAAGFNTYLGKPQARYNTFTIVGPGETISNDDVRKFYIAWHKENPD